MKPHVNEHGGRTRRPLNSNWRKELDKFRSVLKTVDTNKDGKISQSEFMTACQKGELKNIQL